MHFPNERYNDSNDSHHLLVLSSDLYHHPQAFVTI